MGMGYYRLLQHHPRTIGFGFLQAFFSGLGQTHFIALYTPLIMTSFALSATEYGSLYSLVTLISGFTISFVGPWIDRLDARYFSIAIGLGLLLSLFFVLPMSNIWAVAVGLFGLRLFGQGLCSSLSSITVARYFSEGRGKALSLSQLGFPFYEGLITPLGAYLLDLVSFQSFVLIFSVSVIVFYLPLAFFLTRNVSGFNSVTASSHAVQAKEESATRDWTRKEVFTSFQAYMLIPHTLMPPFALTGVFFHQALIAQSKGWSLALIASGLVFFAAGRVINSFITGPLVDKHTAIKLFPFYQIPLALGFLLLGWGESVWIPAFSFLLFGLSVGSGGPIKSAIWAELYGIKHLGAIKSLFATFMVFSTAASPGLFGWILDTSHSSTPLLYSLFIASFFTSALAWLGLRDFPKSTETSK